MRQKIDSEVTFWRMTPAGSSAISGGVATLAWEGNEYFVGTNSGGTVTANLPSGAWTIKVWDVMAKSEKVISTSATGRQSISTASSRAGAVHIKKNGIGPDPEPGVEHSISLSSGWNLISLPVQPADTSTAAVLSSINGRYGAVYAYDSGSGSYRQYIPGESGNNLTQMEAGRGYWVYMTEGGTLRVRGNAATGAISLVEGWNLVGFNSRESQSASSALSSIESRILAVYGFDTSANRYREYLPGTGGDLSTLDPGRGYWIYATENVSWD
jgi:hypothetical protein